MTRRFEHKAAVVTGAGLGIGEAIARALAREGAQVVLNDVDADRAEAAASAIEAEGGTCLSAPGDVADVGVVRGLADLAMERFGRLDIAVANAGLTLWGDFFSYEPEQFDRMLAVNLRGSYFLAQAAARHMRAHGSGRVLLMSSVGGHQAIRYMSAYGITKAGLEMLARNLVLELAPWGITVNALAPGATLTARNLADDPNYEQVWGAVTPTGRPATVDDIAAAALFFLSDEARHITGQALVVDGGWTSYSPTPSLDFVETPG